MRSDLGVLDPPSTAAVLPLHPDRVRSLFTSPVSSITNTACRVGEMVDDVVAGLLRHPVRVPDSPGQQVLRAVRTGVAGVLGDRPAVLARQIGQQPEQEPAPVTFLAPLPSPGRSGRGSDPATPPRSPTSGKPYPGPRVSTTPEPPDVLPPDDGHAVAGASSANQDEPIYGGSTKTSGTRREMRILMIAPPGAGKGTQGAIIAAHFQIRHIATGDLLRAHVADQTTLGLAVKRHLDVGELVPDQIVLEMVREALVEAKEAGGGYVLDGVPRTMAQAKAA